MQKRGAPPVSGTSAFLGEIPTPEADFSISVSRADGLPSELLDDRRTPIRPRQLAAGEDPVKDLVRQIRKFDRKFEKTADLFLSLASVR